MYALKWYRESTRMFFDGGAPSASTTSDSGGGSGSASSNPTPASGSEGGGSSVSTPSPDAGAASSPSQPASPDPIEDWSNLGSTDDLDAIEVPAQPVTPAAPEPKPVVPPAPAPATPTPAPVVPPATPPTAAPAQPQTEPQAQPQAPLSPADPVSIATALEANRDVAIAHLAQTRFALSQEDIAELEDNAAAFVPKMMARVLHESQVSMMKFLAQSVPGMVQRHTTVTQANTKVENQFFNTHKALGLDSTNEQHREVAFRLAKAYRQANPNMSTEQLIAEVGPIVAATLKLPLPQPGAAPVAAAPQTPAMPRPVQPFRPAVGGGGGAPPIPAPQDEWSGMGQDYDQG